MATTSVSPNGGPFSAVTDVHEAHDGADNVIVFTIPPIPPCMNSSLHVYITPHAYCEYYQGAKRIEH